MEYVKDGFFKIQYNTKLNRLKLEKENWTSRFYKKVKRNKVLTISLITFCMFSVIDIIMICNFFKVLGGL